MLLRSFYALCFVIVPSFLFSQINIQWEARLNGTGNFIDKAVDLGLDADANTYVTGSSFSGTSFDIVTVKYDADGAEVWRSIYGGTGVDEAYALVLDGEGNVIVTGSRFISGSDWDIVTIKYDGDTGAELWSVIHAGSTNFDIAGDVAVDGSNNVIVAGSLNLGGGNIDFLTIKYNSSGTLLWSDSFGGFGSDDAKLVKTDAAGNIYVGGQHEFSSGSTYFDFRLVKYNAAGVVQFSVTADSGFGNLDSPNAMALDAAGNIILGGQGFSTVVKEEDYLTIKFNNTTGAMMWRKLYNGSADALDEVNAVTTDALNNVYVTGRSKSAANSENFYTIAYNSAGTQIWADSYTTPGLRFDEGTDLRVADSGLHLYVTGYSFYTATNNDFTTIKYNVADGTREWITIFNGPSSNSDQALKMRLDAAENIFITGNSHGGSTNLDYSTIKYCQLTTEASADTAVCLGESVDLTATGGDDITWSVLSGDTESMSCTVCETMTATPDETTTYVVSSESISGCIDYDTVSVVVNPIPSPSIYNDTPLSFCEGGSVTLYTDTYASYDWSTGSETISTTVAIAGTVTLTIVDGNGCTNTTSAEVTVFDLPTVEAGADQSICPEGVAPLGASGATSYLWDFDPTLSVLASPTPTADPSVDTEYFVTGTDDNGCQNRDSVTVFVFDSPAVNAGPNGSVCLGNAYELMASGATTYAWDFHPTLSSLVIANPLATPTTLTEYFVTGTDDNGCTNIDSVIVSTTALPNISVGDDTTVCEGGSVQLFASGGLPTMYVWDADPTLSATDVFNPTATPTSSTTYTVTGTDINGCSNTSDVFVLVYDLPPVDAGADASICIGDSVQLMASGATDYGWDFDPTLSALDISDPWASPITTRTYTVTGEDDNGCINEDDVIITVNTIPDVSAGTDMTICMGDSIQLMATGAVIYTWDADPSLSSVVIADPWAMPTATTTYRVEGTSGASCTDTASVDFTVNPLPTPPVLTKDGVFIISSYETGNQWYLDGMELPGETNDTINYAEIGMNGEYWVVYTGGLSCSVESNRIENPIFITDVGIDELVNFNVTIFPNPTNGVVTVKADELLDGIRVQDLKGSILMEYGQTNSNSTELDFSTLPAGVYFLQLVKDGQLVTKKVVKY